MSAIMKSAALGAAVVLVLGTMASAATIEVAHFQNRLVAPFGNGTETYAGEEDTYLNGGATTAFDKNYGGATVMVGNNARGDLALIRFDLSSMQGQFDHITSASLIVRATVNPATLPAMNIYAINEANGGWVAGSSNNTVPTDGSSTFNNMKSLGANNPSNVPWTSGRGIGINSGDSSNGGTATDTSDPNNWGFGPTALGTVTFLSLNRIQLNIPPALIVQWINNGNYGLVLTTTAGTYADIPTFYTSEQNSTASPELVISYSVPEPMTGTILLLSGGLLLLRRRRTRHGVIA